MLRRVIIFLVRKRLGLKKYETFQFAGQKTNAVYYFTEINVMKHVNGCTFISNVSFNWLLDEACEIIPCELATKELMTND